MPRRLAIVTAFVPDVNHRIRGRALSTTHIAVGHLRESLREAVDVAIEAGRGHFSLSERVVVV